MNFFNLPFSTKIRRIYHYVTLIMLGFALFVVGFILLFCAFILINGLLFIFYAE